MPESSRRLFDTAPIALYEVDLRRLVTWLDAGGLRADPERILTMTADELDAGFSLVSITDVNDVALRLANTTREDILTSGVNLVNRHALMPFVLALARGETVLEHETDFMLGGIQRRIVLRAEFPAEVIALGRVVISGIDVTDARQIAERLHDARRLESLALLAGSVAHDFNNLLTIARLNADRLARRVPAAEGKELERLRDATTRAAALARQLLLFSRREVAQPQRFDPDVLLAALEPLLRRTLDPQIAISIERTGPRIGVELDPAQLEQVVHNLVLNAADAMVGGGTLRVVRGRRGERVTISVIDTGSGMDAATRARLFDPFFTTRPGKRAGLGLSIVHGIVTRANGTVTVDTGPTGTCVEVELPGVELVPTIEIATITGTERILLVEDEDGLRDVARITLEEAGYCVVAARNGDEAIVAADGDPSIDLVISDLVMPGIPARELVGKLRAARPTLPVLYISGYAADGPPALEGEGRIGFLAKPFTADQLLRSVRAVLP